LSEHPAIIQAFEPDNSLYLILSGSIYIMDEAGMYDYGIIHAGSYFGDIGILLKKKNIFSYFFNPFAEKPLELIKITHATFVQICDKFPVEHEIWEKRARERD
jgi:CRP-like cAMP-binding protein